jgi:hypothetical protein
VRVKRAHRIKFDREAFDKAIAEGCYLSAIVQVELAVLDLPGNHRARSDVIVVTRQWLNNAATIPRDGAAACRVWAKGAPDLVRPFWERLALAVEAKNRKWDAEDAAAAAAAQE